jgi:hypothetical protein
MKFHKGHLIVTDKEEEFNYKQHLAILLQKHEEWKEQKKQEEIALYGPNGKPKEEDNQPSTPPFRKNASHKAKVMTNSIMNKEHTKDVSNAIRLTTVKTLAENVAIDERRLAAAKSSIEGTVESESQFGVAASKTNSLAPKS